MGNNRFRLSDIMPNAWFYKLKDMNKPNTRNHHHSTPKTTTKRSQPFNPGPPNSYQNENQTAETLIPSRASYYFPSNSPLHPKASDALFPLDPPRKSSRKHRKKPTSPRLISSCRNPVSEPEPESNDIVFDLPPILTKLPTKQDYQEKQHIKKPVLAKPPKEEEEIKKPAVQGIHRLRARATSPRVGSRKVRVVQRGSQRNGLSESFAVVKTSSDPRRDFRDSMMEMIREYELRKPKDLEELLACFLALNSVEYHDVIVKVFEEIWFHITDRYS